MVSIKFEFEANNIHTRIIITTILNFKKVAKKKKRNNVTLTSCV